VILYDFRNESDDCDAGFIYEEDEDLKRFACSEKVVTSEVLTLWYTTRVHEIENRSCIIDHALTLIKLARERHIMVSPEKSVYSEQERSKCVSEWKIFLCMCHFIILYKNCMEEYTILALNACITFRLTQFRT
jgi:hypothetical protein